MNPPLLIILLATIMLVSASDEVFAQKSKTDKFRLVEVEPKFDFDNEVPITEGLKNVPEHERVEELPEYPGGTLALMKYLRQIKLPKKTEKVSARIYVQFSIDKAGKVINPEILREEMLTGLPAAYTAAIIEHLNKMPDWTPGMLNGEPKESYMIVQFVF